MKTCYAGFPGGLAVRKPPSTQESEETGIQSLCLVGAPEEAMATHSSILVWRILRTEEPGRLQFTVSQESDTTEAPEQQTCYRAKIMVTDVAEGTRDHRTEYKIQSHLDLCVNVYKISSYL